MKKSIILLIFVSLIALLSFTKENINVRPAVPGIVVDSCMSTDPVIYSCKCMKCGYVFSSTVPCFKCRHCGDFGIQCLSISIKI